MQIDLMDRYPKAKRDINHRFEASEEDRRLSKLFGKEYFDGTRQQGLGGYYYDGRWKPVVERFIEHYNLQDGCSILDVGCAKGFMLHDFKQTLPNCKIAGLDISQYCYETCMEDVKPYYTIGSCDRLPYPDKSFDLVVSIATVHNLDPEGVKRSLREIERVSKAHKFIKVNGYRNEEEKDMLFRWNVVANTILHVDEWHHMFEEVNYTGDYIFFVP